MNRKMGARWTRAEVRMERTLARRGSPWEAVGGALPIVAALALWALMLAGVAAPLGDALAHLDRPSRPEPAQPACAVPPGALAAAPERLSPPSRSCP